MQLAALILAAGSLVLSASAFAQTPEASPAAPASVTHHSGVFGGRTVAYTATAGDTVVLGAGGAAVASLFSVAYVADGAPADRPVVFGYNGGPGSASAYLHLGALGPVRADFPTDLTATPAAPYALSPNPSSLLDVADVVLIDAPETGYSHTLPGDAKQTYLTMLGDAQIMADFIRAWLRANGREASPKFILGESYGATRTPLVAAALLHDDGGKADVVHLDGLLLLSQMLTVDDLGDRPMNAAGYAAALPSIAAVAWYHDRAARRGRSFAAFIADAERFAYQTYMPALMQGDALPAAERRAVAAQLADFSGLSAELILQHGLMLNADLFRRSLYPGQLVGGYDGRYVGPPAGPGGPAIADPGQRQTVPIVGGAITPYLQDQLGVRPGQPYVLENRQVGGAWYFGDKRRLPATTFLSDYIARQPGVRVFVAQGYDDLVTPFATGRFLVAHLPVKPGQAEFHAYVGGHMFYSNAASLAAFAHDARAFIRAAAKARP